MKSNLSRTARADSVRRAFLTRWGERSDQEMLQDKLKIARRRRGDIRLRRNGRQIAVDARDDGKWRGVNIRRLESLVRVVEAGGIVRQRYRLFTIGRAKRRFVRFLSRHLGWVAATWRGVLIVVFHCDHAATTTLRRGRRRLGPAARASALHVRQTGDHDGARCEPDNNMQQGGAKPTHDCIICQQRGIRKATWDTSIRNEP